MLLLRCCCELNGIYLIRHCDFLSFYFRRSDSGLLQGKPVTKKENGTPAYGGSTSSASSVLENNVSRQLPSNRSLFLHL